MKYLVAAAVAEFDPTRSGGGSDGYPEAERYAVSLAEKFGGAFIITVDDNWREDAMAYENVGVVSRAATEKQVDNLFGILGEDEET